MLTPKVTEISALSAHRRQVALVRWSLLEVPEPPSLVNRIEPRELALMDYRF